MKNKCLYWCIDIQICNNPISNICSYMIDKSSCDRLGDLTGCKTKSYGKDIIPDEDDFKFNDKIQRMRVFD